MTQTIRVQKFTQPSGYGWNNEFSLCPVCKEWKSSTNLKRHISKKRDKKHKDFVQKFTKVIQKKVFDVVFI